MMAKQHQQPGLRRTGTADIDDERSRHLQGDKNKSTEQPTSAPTKEPKKDKKDELTTQPTFAPTMAPTKKMTAVPISDDMFVGYLSLEWSLMLLSAEEINSLPITTIADISASSNNGVAGLKNWISQAFLCFDDTIWLTSNLATLDSDCQSTIRRNLEYSLVKDINLAKDIQPYSNRTILWNKPVVMESREILEATNTEYTVWSIQYPVYSYADDSNKKNLVEERLQTLLNKQIQNEALVWEDGILAVVGDEMNVFASGGPYYSDQTILFELGSMPFTSLQALGLLLAVAHTICLFILHVFGKPFLKDQARKKRRMQLEQQGVYLPPVQHVHAPIKVVSHQRQDPSLSALGTAHLDPAQRTQQQYAMGSYLPGNIRPISIQSYD